MKVIWTQMNETFNYNLSRFQLFLDENQSLISYSDKKSLETCLFNVKVGVYLFLFF